VVRERERAREPVAVRVPDAGEVAGAVAAAVPCPVATAVAESVGFVAPEAETAGPSEMKNQWSRLGSPVCRVEER